MKSIFVYNPESGRGKLNKYKDYIINELSKKYGEIEVVETTYAGHAHDIAKASVNNYDYFFVSGGDGTLNEVVNGFGDSDNAPVVGYIPSGTINDVAHSLGISKNIKKAVKTILEGEIFEHDIFNVNDRFGVYVCCSGLFSKCSFTTKRQNKKIFGRIAYFFKGAKDIFTTKPVHVELITDGEKIKRNCAMILILNTRSTAGFSMNKKAELNDGQVEVILCHSHKNKVKLGEVIRTLLLFIRGVDKYKNNKKITYLKLDKFTINMQDETIINLDGEKSGEGSFNFKVIKSKLKIIVPKK